MATGIGTAVMIWPVDPAWPVTDRAGGTKRPANFLTFRAILGCRWQRGSTAPVWHYGPEARFGIASSWGLSSYGRSRAEICLDAGTLSHPCGISSRFDVPKERSSCCQNRHSVCTRQSAHGNQDQKLNRRGYDGGMGCMELPPFRDIKSGVGTWSATEKDNGGAKSGQSLTMTADRPPSALRAFGRGGERPWRHVKFSGLKGVLERA